MADSLAREIARKKFTTTTLRKGYDQDEVDEFLENIERKVDDLEVAKAHLDEKLRRAGNPSTMQLEAISNAPTQVLTKPEPTPLEQATQVLAMAEETAQKVIDDGQSEANRVISEAHADATRIIEDAKAQASAEKEAMLRVAHEEVAELNIRKQDIQTHIDGLYQIKEEYKVWAQGAIASLREWADT